MCTAVLVKCVEERHCHDGDRKVSVPEQGLWKVFWVRLCDTESFGSSTTAFKEKSTIVIILLEMKGWSCFTQDPLHLSGIFLTGCLMLTARFTGIEYSTFFLEC